MTRVVIFAGPTSSAELGGSLLPRAEFRPPAACGDVLGAVLEGVRVIGLVDGYFDHRLSVWHKEILWALSLGVRVYGAASMGALRAAELAAFGMVGVGEVFEAYARGELEDDDEVAVAHEPAERGYRPTSEAMVNLRATLAKAARDGVLSASAAEALVQRQKERFYPERSLGSLMADAQERLAPAEFAALSPWLRESGIVNQKRADARALLLRIAADVADSADSADVAAGSLAPGSGALPEFPHTNAWQALVERVTGTVAPAAASARARAGGRASVEPIAAAASVCTTLEVTAAAEVRAILAEIEQRDVVLHSRVWRLAVERALAVALAQRLEHEVDPAHVQAEADRVRRELGLLSPAQTSEWLRSNDLDVPGFSRLVTDGVLAADLAAPVEQAIDGQLCNVLRLLGYYPRGPYPRASPG